MKYFELKEDVKKLKLKIKIFGLFHNPYYKQQKGKTI